MPSANPVGPEDSRTIRCGQEECLHRPLLRHSVYPGAIDHVLDVGQNVNEETGWKRFRGMVKRLSTAFALAVPREETKEVAVHGSEFVWSDFWV